jgi:hypothetical protein
MAKDNSRSTNNWYARHVRPDTQEVRRTPNVPTEQLLERWRENRCQRLRRRRRLPGHK